MYTCTYIFTFKLYIIYIVILNSSKGDLQLHPIDSLYTLAIFSSLSSRVTGKH